MNNFTFVKKLCGVSNLLHKRHPLVELKIVANVEKILQRAQLNSLVKKTFIKCSKLMFMVRNLKIYQIISLPILKRV